MLPLLGPTNLRDGIGRLGETVTYYPNRLITNSNAAALGLTALDVIDNRANLLIIDGVLESQIDQYSFIKNAYESDRVNKIYDGSPPEASEQDFDF